MNPDIQKLLLQREEKNSNMFFITPETVEVSGCYSVVKRKNLFGINRNEEVVFQPIFDEVRFLVGDLCILRIKDSWALGDAGSGEFLLDLCYADISQSTDGLIAVRSHDDLSGLYDSRRRKIIIPTEYEEYGSPLGVEYIWVRRGNLYDFIEKSTGRLIRIGGLSRVFDSGYGMFGVNSSGRVIMIGPDGYENPIMLRKVVKDAGGYLCLQNHAEKTEVFIDVYGNILNV